MRALAALLLHILSVHYLLILFILGFPALVTGIKLRKKRVFGKYTISRLCYLIFGICLAGGFVFPSINIQYLKHYGQVGEAVVITSSQQPAWFQRTPEVRLVVKIVSDDGVPFIETLTTNPPVEIIDRLSVGNKVEVLYSPDYTHNIAVLAW